MSTKKVEDATTTVEPEIPLAAAAAPTEDVVKEPDEKELATTTSLVAFLRAEADAAEAKAKSFRKQAKQLADTFGISLDVQERYEIDPEDLPPLDEHGVPKYRGKKRGRKPKARKRKANPNRKKRKHTGYTLFMHERYHTHKQEHPEYASKDIIALVAKQWKELTAEEQGTWKEKALATHEDDDEAVKGEGGDEADTLQDAKAVAALKQGGDEEEEVDPFAIAEEEEKKGAAKFSPARISRASKRKKRS